MCVFRFTALALLLLAGCCWADDEDDNGDEDESKELAAADLGVSDRLDIVNSNRIPAFHDPILIGGDIAVDTEAEKDSDLCSTIGCLWGKWSDGTVYIPYHISNQFSSTQKAIITRGLESFSTVSCVRFRPNRRLDKDWLNIDSGSGCYSYIGRRGGMQLVSLSKKGCLHHGTIQHELLHALGFNHEQTRADRDTHIQVLVQNIMAGMEHNFRKAVTKNQVTPYDYNSVMQYHRYAFSKNGQPTMIPTPDANVALGNAKEMSHNDIARLNILYKCGGPSM